jgi:hypothetical protein
LIASDTNIDEENYQKELVTLHKNTAAFIKKNSLKIIINYNSLTDKKFNRTCKPTDKKYLSSTAIGTYVITQFEKTWAKDPNFQNFFYAVEDYWSHITKVLKTVVPTEDNEAPDEFTILNIMPLLLEIGLSQNRETTNLLNSNEGIIKRIFFSLCNQFVLNQFKFRERAHHPFLYYRFLKVLQNWEKVLNIEDQQTIAIKVIRKYGSQIFQNLALSDEREKKVIDLAQKLQECALQEPAADLRDN